MEAFHYGVCFLPPLFDCCDQKAPVAVGHGPKAVTRAYDNRHSACAASGVDRPWVRARWRPIRICWKAFPLFAAGVLVAQVTKPLRLNDQFWLAALFILLTNRLHSIDWLTWTSCAQFRAWGVGDLSVVWGCCCAGPWRKSRQTGSVCWDAIGHIGILQVGQGDALKRRDSNMEAGYGARVKRERGMPVKAFARKHYSFHAFFDRNLLSSSGAGGRSPAFFLFT